jgi:homoserine dehydrogenase
MASRSVSAGIVVHYFFYSITVAAAGSIVSFRKMKKILPGDYILSLREIFTGIVSYILTYKT